MQCNDTYDRNVDIFSNKINTIALYNIENVIINFH